VRCRARGREGSHGHIAEPEDGPERHPQNPNHKKGEAQEEEGSGLFGAESCSWAVRRRKRPISHWKQEDRHHANQRHADEATSHTLPPETLPRQIQDPEFTKRPFSGRCSSGFLRCLNAWAPAAKTFPHSSTQLPPALGSCPRLGCDILMHRRSAHGPAKPEN